MDMAVFDIVKCLKTILKCGVSDNGQESTKVGKEDLSQMSRQRAH